MKNFFDTKDEKITEKAFSQSLLISVLSILLCIVALCSITYAWFTGETSSGSNTLVSGSFDITVSVDKDGSAIEVGTDGKYTLAEAGRYTIELNPSQEASVKGYCIVTINGATYKTGVILNADMVDDTYTTATAPFTFTIITEKENTVVTFESHWGVLVDPDVVADTVITVESHLDNTNPDITE